jgi:hypothetical protein
MSKCPIRISGEKRPLRRQPEDHHEGALLLSSRGSNPLRADWQRHVLASSGYLELGMFDTAALVLEEIAPEDKNRHEVLGARVALSEFVSGVEQKQFALRDQ